MDLSRYLGLFVSDAREHLAALEADLVRLEGPVAGPAQRTLVDDLFRHLHSLKGSSATMGFEPIAAISHGAEALAGLYRDSGAAFRREHIDLLLRAGDALKGLVDSASEGRELAPEHLLSEQLRLAATGLAAPTPVVAAAAAPVAGPSSVFVVVLTEKATAPAARAFLALKKLETLAPVLASDPSADALKAGRLPGNRIRVTLKGDVTEDAVRKVVSRLPDIERVEPVIAEPPTPVRPAEVVPAADLAAPLDQTVRVRVDLLDSLLELAGELVLAGNRVRERLRGQSLEVREVLEPETDRLRLLVKELNNRVLATRQTPLQLLADRLPRVVRDLSQRLDKPLTMTTDGMELTLDRGLIDALVEPVLHAVRNAADHGIESPAERASRGKPREGRLHLAGRRERERVVVELRDDGRGFDIAQLKAAATARGAITAAAAAALTDAQALRLAFLPGLSTRDTASDISGRGVGMDAVLRAVEQLGGSVQLESTASEGSLVRLMLPPAVSVVGVLLLGLGDEVFGVPMNRVVSAAEADLTARGGEGFASRNIVVGRELVPAHKLGRLLGMQELRVVGPRPFVVVEAEGHRAALGVDRVLGQEEVVLRPLGPPIERIRGLAGTAILASGRPIFVLDVPRLVS